MAAKRKRAMRRSRGLSGTPYQHKQEADFFFDAAEKDLKAVNRFLSNGDCRGAFAKLEDAIGTYSVAVNNRTEALTSIGEPESTKAKWKPSLDSEASRLGDMQMRSSAQFFQKCVMKAPLSGLKRRRSRK